MIGLPHLLFSWQILKISCLQIFSLEGSMQKNQLFDWNFTTIPLAYYLLFIYHNLTYSVY